MEPSEVLSELKTIFVTRLKFEPGRVADLGPATPLPKGVPDSLGLDSLDFIELGLALEDRFGIAVDDAAEVAEHFASVESLCRFVAERAKTR